MSERSIAEYEQASLRVACRQNAETVVLYHGDNGDHEFYETAPGQPQVLIISHYKPESWFVLDCDLDVKPKHVGRKTGPLTAIVRDLAECLGVNVAIDPHKEYRDTDPPGRTMVLCELDYK